MKSSVRWKYMARAPLMVSRMLLRRRYDFTFDLMPMSVPVDRRRFANLMRTGLNLIYRKTVPWGWPIHMQFELTNFCDLKCPVCPTGEGLLTRESRCMDVDLFENFLSEAGPFLLTAILWGWGEPLLHPRFGEFVKIARQHRILPITSTNGQTLAKESVQDALIADPPEYLIVAIDGLNDETNSRYRVGAKLEKALSGIQSLVAARKRLHLRRPILHMRYIVMKHNQHEVPEVRDFASRNGFDFLSIRSLSIIDDDESAHRELVPDVKEFRAYDYQAELRRARDDMICQWAFTFPTMLANGSIVACDQDFNASHALGRFGNGTSFRQIWYGPKAAAIRRIIRENRNTYSFCRHCPYADRLTNSCSVEAARLTDFSVP